MKKLIRGVCLALVCALMVNITACTDPQESSSNSLPQASDTTQSSSNSPDTEEVEPAVGIDDFVGKMEKSRYADETLTSTEFGLSNPGRVGIIQSEIKELYGKKDDSEFAEGCVFTFNEDAESDVVELNRLIGLAKEKNDGQAVKIKFPNRPVYLNVDESTSLDTYQTVNFYDFDGLYLEGGEDTVLNFVVGSAWKGAFGFTRCKNVYINDIEIDYPVTPALTGTVVERSSENMTVTVSLDGEYDQTIAAFKKNKTLINKLQSLIEFDVLTGAPRDNGMMLIGSDGFVSSWDFTEKNGQHLVTFTFANGFKQTLKEKLPVKGNKIAFAFTMYAYNGFTIREGENFYMENVQIDTCPGMGIDITSKNAYFNRVAFKPTRGRLMTSTADGLHARACTGDVKITNCEFIGTHDDAANVKSGYYYNLNPTFNYFDKKITITRIAEANTMPEVGDEIAIYRKSDFSLVTTVKVAGCTGNEDTYVIETEKRLPNNDYTDCVATNITHSCDLEFSNNYIANKRNRGILVQTRKAVLKNNTFTRVCAGSIQVSTALFGGYEATVPYNVTIKDNKFINNCNVVGQIPDGDISAFAYLGSGDVGSAGAIQEVVLENNYIAKTGSTAVSYKAVSNSSIKNNLFYNAAMGTDNELMFAAVYFKNSADVTVSGNYNYSTLAKEGFSGITLDGSTLKGDINVTDDNFKMDFLSLEGEVVRYGIDKINDESIVIDGNVEEWATMGNQIDLIGHSVATGAEIAPKDYADVFGVELAKIAISDKGIYLAFSVRDNKMDVKTKWDFWTGDCVEIFMSDYFEMPSTDMHVYKEKGNVAQFAMAPGSNWQIAVGDHRTNSTLAAKIETEWQYKVVLTDTGYAGEVFMPFETMPSLKENLENGGELGIAIVFADNDRNDIDRTRLQVGNVPHFTEVWKMRTLKMPRFTLN